MKIISLLLSLCLASVALAEDPVELVKLRQIWKNSVAEATKSAEETYRSKNIKANKLYYAELNEMKKNFMTAQNLNGANAVDAEIKRLEVSHKVLKFSPPRKPSKPQEKASFLEGAWILTASGGGKHLWIFGKNVVQVGGDKRVKWTRQGDEVTAHFDGGWWDKMKINPDKPDLMEGRNKGGHKLVFERLKW